MAVTKRYGRQTPTRALVLPYTETRGMEAVESYNRSGRTSYPWQELLASDVMAVNEDGLWLHQKFGFSVPRRNGKNEVVVMREIYGLEHGEKICHTAHRTTTSHSAYVRLRQVLLDAGYTELGRMGADAQVDGCTAIINGVEGLHGAEVRACDLRAGAAVVIAGLCATGETVVTDIRFIERGYENFVGKLRGVGADIVLERDGAEQCAAVAAE